MTLFFNKIVAILLSVFLLYLTVYSQEKNNQENIIITTQEVIVDSTEGVSDDFKATLSLPN